MSINVSTPTNDDLYLPTVGDYFSLLKPRVMSLVVFTAIIGIYLAPNTIHPFLVLVSVLCIALGAGASGAINMWYDRDIDCLMKRTQSRAIPMGRVQPQDALALGIVLSVTSIIVLGLATNYLAAGLLAFTIFFYVFIYTMYLKRRTSQNIVIGGAAGAFPPVIGWAAVTNTITLEPIILFTIIFLWTPPHFWALSLYRCEDYVRAKVPMLPAIHGPETTKSQIIIYSILMVLSTVVPYLIGLSSSLYLAAALILGGYFLYLAYEVKKSYTDKKAKKLFIYSIFYLFGIFLCLAIDKAIAGLL